MKVKALTFFFIVLSLAFFTFAQENEKYSTETKTVSLPDSPNSWIINIHQKGGIMGIHKFLLAINSEGKYVCGEKDKVKTLASTDAKFVELSESIKLLNSDIFFKPIIEEFAYCNDCLYSTLSFRRKKEKVRDGEIVLASTQKNADSTAKEIAQKVWKVVKCD